MTRHPNSTHFVEGQGESAAAGKKAVLLPIASGGSRDVLAAQALMNEWVARNRPSHALITPIIGQTGAQDFRDAVRNGLISDETYTDLIASEANIVR